MTALANADINGDLNEIIKEMPQPASDIVFTFIGGGTAPNIIIQVFATDKNGQPYHRTTTPGSDDRTAEQTSSR